MGILRPPKFKEQQRCLVGGKARANARIEQSPHFEPPFSKNAAVKETYELINGSRRMIDESEARVDKSLGRLNSIYAARLARELLR
jgi:hypothetical protein